MKIRALFRFAAMLPLTLAMGASAAFAASPQLYTKTLAFPPDATLEQKVDMASRLVPSPEQLAWQKLGLTAFLHFGVNTFTDREWGDGTEDPAIFNPDSLDADQWVRTLKDAGFQLVILTAKHHDGFCLWPTKTTKHSVMASPWKDGKGDVMAELREACDRHGMKLGVYLSPWDRNAECYGDSPKYNDMFVAQLTELLTNYGRIDEVWFDGACGEGPNGKKQEYDWQRFRKVIKELQPDAVLAIMGDDVRWVGNEKGMGRETEWSATVMSPGIYPGAGRNNATAGVNAKSPDLGGRQVLAKASKLFWWPSEVDVSVRPGWFWHATEQAKPLRQLAEIYLTSVGRNSVLLLNIPPDVHGRIDAADVARLAELKAWIDDNFGKNLAGEIHDYTVDVPAGTEVNTVLLQEDISKGQHMEAFTIEALVDGNWVPVTSGTTIGFKRILTFPAVKPQALRIKIDSCRGDANISAFEAYNIALPAAESIKLPGYRTVSNTDWAIVDATGPLAEAYKVFDDSENIYWQSPAVKGEKFFTVDLGRPVVMAGFIYEPRGGEDKAGTIFHYRFEYSVDGKNWTTAPLSGEFSNIMHNPLPQMVYLPAPVQARYVRLTALDEIDNRDYITVGEFRVLTPEGTLAPKDDETLVWRNPASPLNLNPGDAHPRLKGWKFYTAHEFNGPADRAVTGIPAGWRRNNGKHVGRNARIDDDCATLRSGYLRLESKNLPQTVDNGHGTKVKHSTYALRDAAQNDSDHWCDFTEGMRVEVRARRSNHTGLNDALWFMGNKKVKWPDNGEIDLMENPKATVNSTSHFTLHSKNHHAGQMGGSGSTTANIDLADMSDWNIFWLEWYPDRIVGGVNGQRYFVHQKGENGNEDWPWSDPEKFFMLITSCMSTNPNAWPGAVHSDNWDPNNWPHFDIDWIRVFTNDDFKGQPAPRKFY